VDAPEPGKPFLFTPDESPEAEEAIAAMFAAQSGVASPDRSVAILPALTSDPTPVLEGRVRPTAGLEPRAYGRVVPAKRRSGGLTIELMASKPTPKPIIETLVEDGLEIPSGWAWRRRRLSPKRRLAWLEVPADARPPDALRVLCDTVGALAPESATGRFLLVRGRSATRIGGISLRDD
jgi:hypothetical protein